MGHGFVMLRYAVLSIVRLNLSMAANHVLGPGTQQDTDVSNENHNQRHVIGLRTAFNTGN
jgi:hypothetical protein